PNAALPISRAPRLVLLRQEEAAERGAHAEHAEVVRVDERALDPHRAVLTVEYDFRRVVHRHALEDVGACAQVLEIEVGERTVRLAVLNAQRNEPHHAVRVLVGQRPDQHAVHDAEDRAVRSEEHTSELQSRENLVCSLLLVKIKYYSY